VIVEVISDQPLPLRDAAIVLRAPARDQGPLSTSLRRITPVIHSRSPWTAWCSWPVKPFRGRSPRYGCQSCNGDPSCCPRSSSMPAMYPESPLPLSPPRSRPAPGCPSQSPPRPMPWRSAMASSVRAAQPDPALPAVADRIRAGVAPLLIGVGLGGLAVTVVPSLAISQSPQALAPRPGLAGAGAARTPASIRRRDRPAGCRRDSRRAGPATPGRDRRACPPRSRCPGDPTGPCGER
jgi:hypothetical protein